MRYSIAKMLTSPIQKTLAITLAITYSLVGTAACYAQGLTLDQIVDDQDLDQPLFATFAPGDSQRLFIAEKGGDIKILNLNDNSINAMPFLNIDVATTSEQGLLGLAFHPDFQNNNQFFVNYVDSTRTTRIERYTATDSNTADAASASPILSIAQPQTNHNGGWIGFGPDDLLYIATGDGGGGNDTGTGHTAGIGNSQDITDNLLGKILRVDINSDGFINDATRNYAIPGSNPFVGATGDDEIYAFGLRNPFRASFDSQTGDLFIGDVGQGLAEEINFIASTSSGGENFGWRPREGTFATPGITEPGPADVIDPIFQYLHSGDGPVGFSVTGGNVYRGPIDALDGKYFFTDFVSNRLWSFDFDGTLDPNDFDATNVENFTDWTDELEIINGNDDFSNIASFAEDAEGNLYAISLNGGVFRFAATAIPEPSSAALLGLVGFGWFARRRR